MQVARAQPFIEPGAFEAVTDIMQEAVEGGVFPGAVLIVGKDGEMLYRQSFGAKSVRTSKNPEPLPMTVDTVFDIASLTAIVSTTTLMMKLVEAQMVKLDDRVSRYIQSFGVFGKSVITIGQLLSHTSGLAHWLPFFEELLDAHTGARIGILTSRSAREFVYHAINRSALKSAPGAKQLYSDIGLMLLGEMVETLTGLPLDKAFYRFVAQPLGLKSTSYVDLSLMKRRGIHPVTDVIAPTEDCPWRRRILCGEVHDDNAWAMGGITGHSGLFSSALDLHLFAREMIFAYRGVSSYMESKTLKNFWRGPADFREGSLRYGWDSPSRENGMYESGLSAGAVGMNGFTGCSLWIEPEYGIHIILMSNRVHPSRSNKKILAFRPELHNAVLQAFTGLPGHR